MQIDLPLHMRVWVAAEIVPKEGHRYDQRHITSTVGLDSVDELGLISTSEVPPKFRPPRVT